MLGILAAVVVILVILYFLFSNKQMIPERAEDEFKDIKKDLKNCFTSSDLTDNKEWFEEFLDYWSEDITEEECLKYTEEYNKLYTQKAKI